MSYFTRSESEIRNFQKAPTNPRSAILASCVGAAASLLLAVNAHAGLIFQDTFDSTPTGATRTLVSTGAETASITSTSPLSSGLSLNTTVAAGVSSNSYNFVQYSPTSAATSWAKLASSVTVGANSFLTLNGGFDLFVDQKDTAGTTMWYRLLDLSSISGVNGLRMVLGSNGSNGLKNELIGPAGTTYMQFAGSGTGNVAGSAFGSFNTRSVQIDTGVACPQMSSQQPFHIAYTFSTNAATGLITLKTYVVAGTGEIDTTTVTPYSTLNLYANAAGIGATSLSSGTWGLTENYTTTTAGNWGAGSNVDYDTIRLYDTEAPTVFAANVPEPATVGLVSAGLLLLGLSRRKAWLAHQ